MPGGGGEILDDEVRTDISPLKCTSEEWLMVHREAHKLGLRTTGTMMTGVGETIRHRINHLERAPRAAGRNGWLYRIHSLDVPARTYRTGEAQPSRSNGRRVSRACWRSAASISTTSTTSRSRGSRSD